MDLLSATLLAGIGGTLSTDLWALARRRWLSIPPPDYGLVGRWLGYMRQGRFRHARIADAAALRGEREAWLRQPTLAPALAVGVCTVLAPWLLMQPGMGAGLAARLMPNPNRARLHSLLTHVVFGIGLYATAWLVARAAFQ